MFLGSFGQFCQCTSLHSYRRNCYPDFSGASLQEEVIATVLTEAVYEMIDKRAITPVKCQIAGVL